MKNALNLTLTLMQPNAYTLRTSMYAKHEHIA